MGIVLRALRLEDFVYIKNQFKTTFAQGGGGVKSLVEVTVNGKEENSYDFSPNYAQEFGLCPTWEFVENVTQYIMNNFSQLLAIGFPLIKSIRVVEANWS